jgi:hypothetical protein
MTFNPSYAELLGKELQRERLREAERERLIKEIAGSNPALRGFLLINLQSRWNEYWSKVSRNKTFVSITKTPKNSPSI